MTAKERREIIDYTSPNKALSLIGIAFFVLAAVLFFLMLHFNADILRAAFAGLGMAAFGILLFFILNSYASKIKSSLNEASDAGREALVAEDFKYGDRFLGGKVICGKHYAFGRSIGGIVYIQDIKQIIWKTRYSQEGIPTSEDLTMLMKNGEKVVLCSKTKVDRSDTEFLKIIGAIQANAPDAELIDKRTK